MASLFKKSDPEKDTQIMLGDPKKAIFATVIPFFLSAVVGQINMLADLAWCSGIGSDAVSSIQTVSPLYWVIFDVGLGVGLGCNVLISRRVGAGKRREAENVVSQGTVLAVIIALILAPIIFFAIDPVMRWMDAETLIEMSTAYMTPILICNIFQVLSTTLSGCLRGEGAATKSNFALIFGTMTNIVLDPILIYGLNMGVAGAGVATAASFVISTSAMLYMYRIRSTTLRMSFKGYRMDVHEIYEIMYVGFPKMIEMFLMDLMDALNRVFLIQSGGVDAVTLFSVPFRIMMLAVIVMNSFAMSLTPVSSANIGAHRFDKSITAYRLCLKCLVIFSALLVTVYILLADFLVIPFIQSESMIPMEPELVEILRIDSIMIPAMGASFICNAMLQSMRKPLIALIVTFSRNGLTTLFMALLCGFSVAAMCTGMVLATIIAAVFALLLTKLMIRDHKKQDPSEVTA